MYFIEFMASPGGVSRRRRTTHTYISRIRESKSKSLYDEDKSSYIEEIS